MKVSTDSEKLFFNYFLEKPVLLKSVTSNFFVNKDISDLSLLAKDFYLKFNESPSKDQMVALLKESNDDIPGELVDQLYDINLSQYDPNWLKDTSESWIKWRHFNSKLISTVELIKTTKVTPENVNNVVSQAINMIGTEGNLSLDSDLGLDFFNPKHHHQLKNPKIESGWNFIDNVTGGGYDPKTLIVYAGEQNIGKSIWLANDAANFVRMGHNVAFISAEMSDHKVVKRIGSNLLNVPMSQYDTFAANPDKVKRKLERVSRGLLPPGKLFVKQVPTSQATVLDIEAYIKEIEETTGSKINVLVVDYINILANYRNPNTENTYMKIKQIAEDLRSIAVKHNLLVISATQITRGGWSSTDISMENIAESAGLAHTADMMYAIIQDAGMHANCEYWLKILKIRDGSGKGNKNLFNIDYEHMRITETSEMVMT